MAWMPINLGEMKALIDGDLSGCPRLRAFFHSVAIEPVKWQQSPMGDEGEGFWAIAVSESSGTTTLRGDSTFQPSWWLV